MPDLTYDDETTRDARAWRLLMERLEMLDVDTNDLRVYANDTEHPQAREVFGNYGAQGVRWALRALHDTITEREANA